MASTIKNSIVFLCSLAGLIGCCLWLYFDWSFEPAIGIILGIGGMVASYWPFGRKKPRLNPKQKISERAKWAPIFEDFFWNKAQAQLGTDAIVHDVNRMDVYPDIDQGKGISSWFRVGLMGTYNRGILLGIRWVYISRKSNGKWVETLSEDGSEKVILLGQLPYDSIEHVQFEGDHHYHKPHIFCHFEFNGEPYERLFYGSPFELQEKHPYHYREVAEYLPPPPKWKFWKR